ncbi:MAG: hypothetical protein Kow0047_32450 [Anaerolineae bacterium]
MSRWLQWIYQLHRHEVRGWPMDRWLAAALLVLALVGAVGWIPGGLAIAVIAGALLIALLGIEVWARRRDYVIFHPSNTSDDRCDALLPQDKIPARATGRFSVEGKTEFFVDLKAFFRTFATREHAIIAFVPQSRFLGIGRWPAEDYGLWYIFFQPEQIVSVEPGVLEWGRSRRPALRVLYRHEQGIEIVYLSFDSDEDLERVRGDLLVDAPSPLETN